MSLSDNIKLLAASVGSDVKSINTKLGDVASLSTTADNLAGAVNELDADVSVLQTTVAGKAASVHVHNASDITAGTISVDRLPAAALTDTKVTAVGNHYAPAEDSSSALSAAGGTLTDIANSSTGTQVVTGLKRDAKGHVVGVTSVALKATNTTTDTKNTAGSTDTSSKIFLVGATSQAASPQTYSHDTAYVGTDGCLYSGGAKVLTAHQDISSKIDTAGTGLSKSGTTLNHSNSITAGTAGTSSATNGSTLAVPYVTYDAQGHVTASGTHTHTVTGFLTEHQSLTAYAKLASPALTGTPTAPTAAAGTNTTQLATTAFVQNEIGSKIAAADAMIFKGTIGSSGSTVTSLPDTTAKTGWAYKVATAGTYAGQKCEVGDIIICLTDGSSSTAATWTVVQTNIDGAVTGPASAVASRIAVFDGTTGKVIKDSGYTIAASVPSNAKFTDTTYSAATTSAAGLMSAADKTKLDGVGAIDTDFVAIYEANKA